LSTCSGIKKAKNSHPMLFSGSLPVFSLLWMFYNARRECPGSLFASHGREKGVVFLQKTEKEDCRAAENNVE